jgi:hypothetical protein
MKRAAGERSIPFGVVILAMPGWAPQEDGANALIPFLESEGIAYVDLQHDPRFASRDGLQYPKDSHPTPEYHRRAAQAIAERFTPGEPPGAGGRATIDQK